MSGGLTLKRLSSTPCGLLKQSTYWESEWRHPSFKRITLSLTTRGMTQEEAIRELKSRAEQLMASVRASAS